MEAHNVGRVQSVIPGHCYPGVVAGGLLDQPPFSAAGLTLPDILVRVASGPLEGRARRHHPLCTEGVVADGFLPRCPGEALRSDDAFYCLYVPGLTLFKGNIGSEVGHSSMPCPIVSQSVHLPHTITLQLLKFKLA